ncbi:MAG: hypothetical protein RBU30_03965 [Polyangia bacterium]|jgi:hypothetical protein|nr:hypothetical protein [Polyangia bacterium]
MGLDQPEIQVDPANTLFFPRVVAGTEHRASLVVRNVGRAPLLLGGAELLGGTQGPFSLPDLPSLPLVIEPGGSHFLSVAYSPVVGSGGDVDEETLVLVSNDPVPTRARWPIRLRSANSGPVISIVPGEVDFSLIENHRGPVTLLVTNSGTEPTVVAALDLEGGSEFVLSQVPDLPRPLDVGESFLVEVSCTTADSSEISSSTGIASLTARPESADHQAGSAVLFGPPVADAGPDRETTPLPKQPVYLSGRGSRSLGNTISRYQWTILSYPDGSDTARAFNLGEPQEPEYIDAPVCPPAQDSSPEPCFIPDVPGTYRFQLEVMDIRPVCALGNPGISCEGDGDCCSFQCSGVCGGQAGDGLCREGGGCAIPGVRTAVMELRAFGEGLLVYLTWDGTGDFDLHFVDDFAGRCVAGQQSCRLDSHCAPGDSCNTTLRRQWRSIGDCYWQNPQPDWGLPREDNGVACQTSSDCSSYAQYPDCLGPVGQGRCTNTLDDPRLAKDEAISFGPEIIRLRRPIHAPGPPNVYHLGVHYFPQPNLYQARTATVRVYYEGLEIFAAAQPGVALARQLTNQPNVFTSFWYVGWLVMTPSSATLIPSGLPTFNVQGTEWPALQDPP